MQTQHLIIMAAGSALGLGLMAYFIRKLLLRAWNRGYAAGHNHRFQDKQNRIANLNGDLARLNGIVEVYKEELATLWRQVQRVKATPFTMDDHQTLMDIAHLLRVAHDTWKAIPNTGPMQLKAATLTKHAQALAYRVFGNVTSATALNGEPLDTQLIEWLNTEPEAVTICVTVVGEVHTEHGHLREVLREAYEQARQARATDQGEQPAENAA
ncbi:hypothetical protein [Pseudomonas sp. GW531-T4]|uniref:hypothetical protein n=1 Tax=Pseudomonas sp. GW531-T4 TaxID=2075553 RepID=UPI000CD0CFE1|nr:hypothetical protein [Pseudomonas sp. GW531-T4]POA75379.1 hypothetical protein C1888_00305 [Pseudomonas sp. GW531-T4]